MAIILILTFECKEKIFINLSKHPVCLRHPLLINTVSVSVNRVGLRINSLSEGSYYLSISYFPYINLFLWEGNYSVSAVGV